MRRQAPLAYFYPVARGVYQAIYPVFLVDEDPAAHEFAVDLGQYTDLDDDTTTSSERRYTRRLTLYRLHQVLFRPRALRAYDSGRGSLGSPCLHFVDDHFIDRCVVDQPDVDEIALGVPALRPLQLQ
jgi:hypothetical protein